MCQVRREVKGRWWEGRKFDRVQCVMWLGRRGRKQDRGTVAGFPGCLGWLGRLKTHLEIWTWGVQVVGLGGGAHNNSAVGIANFSGLEQERGCLETTRAEQVAATLSRSC